MNRTQNPEYIALRDAHQASRPDLDAATSALLDYLADNSYVLCVAARAIADSFPADGPGSKRAETYLEAYRRHEDTTTAQMNWIDAHPEAR